MFSIIVYNDFRLIKIYSSLVVYVYVNKHIWTALIGFRTLSDNFGRVCENYLPCELNLIGKGKCMYTLKILNNALKMQLKVLIFINFGVHFK